MILDGPRRGRRCKLASSSIRLNQRLSVDREPLLRYMAHARSPLDGTDVKKRQSVSLLSGGFGSVAHVTYSRNLAGRSTLSWFTYLISETPQGREEIARRLLHCIDQSRNNCITAIDQIYARHPELETSDELEIRPHKAKASSSLQWKA
jgi:hypothetical protein